MTFLFVMGKPEWERPHSERASGTEWMFEGMHSLGRDLGKPTLSTQSTVSWTRLVGIISDLFGHWQVQIIAYLTKDCKNFTSATEDEACQIAEANTLTVREKQLE